MSATPAAQLARLKVSNPEWQIGRLDSGWLTARRGREEIVVPTLADLELRLNSKPRKGARRTR
jgi:hypothetical protein